MTRRCCGAPDLPIPQAFGAPPSQLNMSACLPALRAARSVVGKANAESSQSAEWPTLPFHAQRCEPNRVVGEASCEVVECDLLGLCGGPF